PPSNGDPNFKPRHLQPVPNEPAPESAEQDGSTELSAESRDWTKPANKSLATKKAKELIKLAEQAKEMGIHLNASLLGRLGMYEHRIEAGMPSLGLEPTDAKYQYLLELIQTVKDLIDQKVTSEVERLNELREELIDGYGEEAITALGLVELLKEVQPGHNRSLEQRFGYCRKVLAGEIEVIQQNESAPDSLEAMRQAIVDEFGEKLIKSCQLHRFLLNPVEPDHNRELELHFNYCRSKLAKERTKQDKVNTPGPHPPKKGLNGKRGERSERDRMIRERMRGSSTGASQPSAQGIDGGKTRNAKRRQRRRHGVSSS
ncbi:hypothetical protein HY857_01075, partial [Candidatus Saccharibacteria bacterium]|nr:hypothetical protein [Candidatus Saccharibacteria bacterium]